MAAAQLPVTFVILCPARATKGSSGMPVRFHWRGPVDSPGALSTSFFPLAGLYSRKMYFSLSSVNAWTHCG